MRDRFNPPASDKLMSMITQKIKNVKLNDMAESEGHDPYSPKANEKFIGLAPTLWDSLSCHNLIITFHHKKTIIKYNKERKGGN